jgi:hypothetical protein
MSSSDEGFSWDSLWANWKGQTVEIQKQWMMGSNGLYSHLKEIVERYPLKVQDEVFGFAPKDVQTYFGYGVKPTVPVRSNSHLPKYIQDMLNSVKT